MLTLTAAVCSGWIAILTGTIVTALQTAVPPQRSGVSGGMEITQTQGTQDDVQGTVATIIQSGSTNTVGYEVAIHSDGSATVRMGGAASPAQSSGSRQFAPGTVDMSTLLRLLNEIGDVSSIPIGRCAKSASFGTSTHIRFAGKESGDLQCVQTSGSDSALVQPSEELAKCVRGILMQLKIDNRRVPSNR